MEKRPIKTWITIKHVHIPIFEGETKQDAVNRFKEGVRKGKQTAPIFPEQYNKKRDAAEKAVNALQKHQERVDRANERIKTDTSAEAQKEKLNADRTFKEAMQRYSTRQQAFDAIKDRRQIKSYEFRKKQVDKELSERQDQISRTQQEAERLNNFEVTPKEDKFTYKRSLELKPWSEAEERRTKETSNMVHRYNTASNDFGEVYESDNFEDVYEMELNEAEYGVRDGVPATITKQNFVYATGWDENENRVKRGKSVAGSTFYTVSINGEILNEDVLGYKTLGDAKHALELELDHMKQYEAWKRNKNQPKPVEPPKPKEPEYERTPKMDWIEKRIEGKQAELDKLEKKMERINKAKESDYKENNPYYYSDYDFRSTTKDIENAKKSLQDYKDQMEKEIEKAKSRNVPVITEFLNDWEQQSIEYFTDQKKAYEEAKEAYYAKNKEYQKWFDETRWKRGIKLNSPEYKAKSDEYHKFRDEFDKEWRHVKQFFDGPGTWEENMRNAVRKEKYAKYDDIITRTNDLIGQITDAGALHIGGRGDLNGVIVGTKGKASVETIGAGGYNIQRYHFRTLINKLKERTIAPITVNMSGRWPVTLNGEDTYTIWRSGGIQSDYGETVHLIEVQKNHLVFETESGAKVKTDYNLNTVGKAKEQGYAFTPRDITNDKNFKKSRVSF